MHIITLETLPSTNDYLMDLSKKNANSWTVIHVINQTNGKGYAGNQWESVPNQNLTFSFLLKTQLNYRELIFLNQWVANCIYSSIVQFYPALTIKWPNDLILNDKKFCGVLIENYKHKEVMNSIIGIGMNINQTNFDQFPHATSLRLESSKSYDIMSILQILMTTFENEFYLIENKNWDLISAAYNDKLYRKNKVSNFKIDGELKEGVIKYADENGCLIVEIENEQKSFMHKQIELIF